MTAGASWACPRTLFAQQHSLFPFTHPCTQISHPSSDHPPQLPNYRTPKHHSSTDVTDQPASHQLNNLPTTLQHLIQSLAIHLSTCPPIPPTIQPPISYPLPINYPSFINSSTSSVNHHLLNTSNYPFTIHLITRLLSTYPLSIHWLILLSVPSSHSSLYHLPTPWLAIHLSSTHANLPLIVPLPSHLLSTNPLLYLTPILSHHTHCARLSTHDAVLGVPPPSVPPHGGQAQPLQGCHDHVDIIVAGAEEAAMGIQPGVWGQPGQGMVRA